MANTYTKISSSTVGAAGVSSIDFTSIPATYTDLCLKISVRSDETGSNNGQMIIQFNSDATAGNYTGKLIYGSGSAAGSTTQGGTSSFLAAGMDSAGNTASTFANFEMYISNYASSNIKSTSSDGVAENNATAAYSALTAYNWSGTAAITSINIKAGTSQKFVQYSTATLYGISKT